VAAAVGAWLHLERGRPVPAGLLIGLVVAFRPNLVPWPIVLALSGAWPVATTSLATAGLISLIPVMVYGPGIYHSWVTALVSLNWPFLPDNTSLLGVASRLGVPGAGTLLGGMLLGGIAIWAWRTRPPATRVTAVALVGALLASPTAWLPYTLLLLPLFFAYPKQPILRVAAVLLVVPGDVVWILADRTPLDLLIFGSRGLVALALVLAAAAVPERAPTRANAIWGSVRSALQTARLGLPRPGLEASRSRASDGG
jgi:hypothetical protein